MAHDISTDVQAVVGADTKHTRVLNSKSILSMVGNYTLVHRKKTLTIVGHSLGGFLALEVTRMLQEESSLKKYAMRVNTIVFNPGMHIQDPEKVNTYARMPITRVVCYRGDPVSMALMSYDVRDLVLVRNASEPKITSFGVLAKGLGRWHGSDRFVSAELLAARKREAEELAKQATNTRTEDKGAEADQDGKSWRAWGVTLGAMIAGGVGIKVLSQDTLLTILIAASSLVVGSTFVYLSWQVLRTLSTTIWIACAVNIAVVALLMKLHYNAESENTELKIKNSELLKTIREMKQNKNIANAGGSSSGPKAVGGDSEKASAS